jgi:hypothetical protein
MSMIIPKQWLDLSLSSTGLTADDIKYSDTTSIKSVLDNINYTFSEYNTQLSTRSLTVTKSGTGSGTITSNPSGINCGNTCEYQYDLNSTITLTASPDSTSVFSGWSGGATGFNSTATVTMSSNKIINAIFDKMCTLTVTKAGSGSGTITSNPSGINCGATCSYQFLYGTSVVLTATPDSGSAFNGWSGDTVGTDTTITVTMNSNKNVTATFNPAYTLTITKSGSGTGIVTSNPSGINCGATCSYRFVSGTSVTLTATADSSSIFGGWSGDVTGFNTTVMVTMNANKNVTVTFNPAYTLTITKSGTGTGTVTSSPSGINCGSTCSYQFISGTNVTLTAISDTGSEFDGWSGDVTDTNTTTTVTMSANKSVTATFNVVPSNGYFAGGTNPNNQSFIDKLLFNNDSRTTLTITLSQSVYRQSACNSTSSGYFAGGISSSSQSFIDKLLFSNDSRSTLSATLSRTVEDQSACNSTLAGYFANGLYNSSAVYSVIDKLLFSNDSRSTLAATLSQSVYDQSACNSSLAGYFAGGEDGSNYYYSFIDKLSFNGESRSTLTSTLSRSVSEQSACNSSLAGYFAGGTGSANFSFIDKLLFNNESRSILTAILSQSANYQSACNSSLAGYFAGGLIGGTYYSFIDKLLFSDETRSTLSTTLSRSIYGQSACQSGGVL